MPLTGGNTLEALLPQTVTVQLAGSGIVFVGKTLEMTHSSLRLRVSLPAKVGQVLTVTYTAPQLSMLGAVRSCRRLSETAYSVEIELANPIERRKEPRFTITEPATLYVPYRVSNSPQKVTVVDISKSGFAVRVENTLDVGEQIILAFSSSPSAILGAICNLRNQGEGSFVAGARIVDVVKSDAIPELWIPGQGSEPEEQDIFDVAVFA